MSAIAIDLELLEDGVMNLPGCIGVTEGDDGELTLFFAAAAAGLAALVQRDADGAIADVTGTMTVIGGGHNTEYNCALESLFGTEAHFRLVCLD